MYTEAQLLVLESNFASVKPERYWSESMRAQDRRRGVYALIRGHGRDRREGAKAHVTLAHASVTAHGDTGISHESIRSVKHVAMKRRRKCVALRRRRNRRLHRGSQRRALRCYRHRRWRRTVRGKCHSAVSPRHVK